MMKYLTFFLLLLSHLLHAQESIASSQKLKKHNLSVCAIFKNEARYLKEWIEYHRLVGVDHFYLYNNNSTDHFKRVLAPYLKQGVVTLVNWPDFLHDYSDDKAFMWALSTQVSAYENAIKVKAGHETTWLVFLDINEFLVPGEKTTFREILTRHKEHAGITFAIDSFNASSYADPIPKALVIEALELSYDETRNLQKDVVKTIFKPEECTTFVWPPYECLFANNQTSMLVEKHVLRINRYAHRRDGSLFYAKTKRKLDIDNRRLSEQQLASLLQEGFEIEDKERAIGRFVPPLLKTMGFDAGWKMIEGAE